MLPAESLKTNANAKPHSAKNAANPARSNGRISESEVMSFGVRAEPMSTFSQYRIAAKLIFLKMPNSQNLITLNARNLNGNQISRQGRAVKRPALQERKTHYKQGEYSRMNDNLQDLGKWACNQCNKQFDEPDTVIDNPEYEGEADAVCPYCCSENIVCGSVDVEEVG